jgi:hypothetical protein
MNSTANDALAAANDPASFPDMTVLELAIFICVFRARSPLAIREIAEHMTSWFEGPCPMGEIGAPVQRMIARGWLVAAGDYLRAGAEGRAIARLLLEGVIRMLDNGTRLIDVALMMSVLRLTKGELDHDPNAD